MSSVQEDQEVFINPTIEHDAETFLKDVEPSHGNPAHESKIELSIVKSWDELFHKHKETASKETPETDSQKKDIQEQKQEK